MPNAERPQLIAHQLRTHPVVLDN
ncbi:hypothetical protein BGLA2_700134 [Burkholderia gladioli]|nr:hypothetical protein BGLA2_700134 [Burkholderia gladioli]